MSNRLLSSCTFVPQQTAKQFSTFRIYSRSAAESSFQGPYRANQNSRYIELLLVVDQKAFNDFGRSSSKVHQYCKNITAYVNGVSCESLKCAELFLNFSLSVLQPTEYFCHTHECGYLGSPGSRSSVFSKQRHVGQFQKLSGTKFD